MYLVFNVLRYFFFHRGRFSICDFKNSRVCTTAPLQLTHKFHVYVDGGSRSTRGNGCLMLKMVIDIEQS